MKAIGHTEFGEPDVLRVLDLPDPVPGPGTVLVKVHAAAVNPTDTMRVSGRRRERVESSPPPWVPGMDFAGVVEALGESTAEESELAVGDRVMGLVAPEGAQGGYSQLLVVPWRSVVTVPDTVDFVAASTIPMNAMSARQALDLLGLAPGQVIAVTGAAGAFGGYVVEQAKADGLRVIADASPADREVVSGLGADLVLDRGGDLADRIRAAVPEGVDGVADGAVLNELILPALRDGGRIATVRFREGPAERGITFHPVSVTRYVQEHERLQGIRRLVEEGRLTPRVAATYPALDAAEAHRRLARGGTRGRLVLLMDESPAGTLP